MLTHFSLFSGIGGIDLASEWAGFTTVGQCEMADYPYKVLCKHWPDVPKWRDVRDVTADSVRAAGIGPVTLISGGYPCQPHSVAGKRKGKDDDRYLWPEMRRVIEEIRPTWVLGENVAGHITLGLDDTLADLERIGYACRPFTIPAAAVGARHRRDRVFIVAYANSDGQRSWHGLEQSERDSTGKRACYSRPLEQLGDVAYSNGEGLQGHRGLCERAGEWTSWQGGGPIEGIWESEPNVGRVASRVSARMDRLKCLGNAVVPQQVYPILKAIAEIELAKEATP